MCGWIVGVIMDEGVNPWKQCNVYKLDSPPSTRIYEKKIYVYRAFVHQFYIMLYCVEDFGRKSDFAFKIVM